MAKNVTDLVFALYGHDKTASKALKGVGNESKSTADKMAHFGKVAAASFVAVGSAAVAFGASAVKAAVDDEKSQKLLAKTLQNTTKATKAQIAASEQFITKMQLTYGIADDKLRPAFATLARSTRDTAEAQDLLQVAMDVSAGTGKDLSTVSLALAKAHNGNLGALTRLGIPLDKATIKSKDFNKALGILTTTFKGSAKAGAETFSGKMAILQQNFNESKEQIGYALLPIVTKFADYVLKNVVPNIQAFVDGLTGVKDKSKGATTPIHDFGEKVRGVFDLFKNNMNFIKLTAEYMLLFMGALKITQGVAAFSSGMKTIIGLYKTMRSASISAAVAEAFATQGASIPVGLLAAAAVAAGFGVAALNINWSGAAKPTKLQQQQGAAAAVTGAQQQKTGVGAGARAGVGTNTEDNYTYYGATYTWDSKNKTWRNPAGVAVSPPPGAPKRAVGGSVAAGTSYFVGEHGPELFTPANGGMITRTENLRAGVGGLSVTVNVHGSVIQERDLAVSVRDNIAQLMRRRGLNPSILGV